MKTIERKNYIIIFTKKNTFLFILFLMLVFSSCKSFDEEEDYTYSINKVWWSDTIDTNNDGYVQSVQLNMDVRLKESVVRSVKARVYYKLEDASTYTFYAYSNETSIQGNDAENKISVPIGNINKELSRGKYDFKVEIFETNSPRLETETGSKDSLTLSGQKFEESAADKNYSIDAWWSDQYDRNKNDYWQYAKLKININVDADVQKTLDVKLYYRLSKDTSYQLYYQFNSFNIFGQNDDDTISCHVGYTNIELDYGEYDFRIEVYEYGSDILVAYADETLSVLNNVKFEEYDLDSYFYSISKVWWTDSIDLDGDGFTQYRKLNFKVDVDKEEQRSVFAMIYFRHPDSSDYSRCDSTSDFYIFGSHDNNNYNVEMGGIKIQLDSAAYDFLISVYETGTDSIKSAEASVSGKTDALLSKQKFETSLQDIKGRK